MARPSGGDELDDAMAALAAAGVRVLASLLTDEEMAADGLAQEGHAAAGAGLEFLRLPTPDGGVPDRAGALTMAGILHSRLAGGAGVVVHCAAGIGRSSLLAAAVLVLEGAEPAGAWAAITAARGRPVPDNAAQQDFIDRLGARGRLIGPAWPGPRPGPESRA
jgi:protein-tyrosine phosphatase